VAAERERGRPPTESLQQNRHLCRATLLSVPLPPPRGASFDDTCLDVCCEHGYFLPMPTPQQHRSASLPKERFDSLQQEVFLNLWRTYDRLKALEDEAFARVGLSAQQYNTLRLLRS